MIAPNITQYPGGKNNTFRVIVNEIPPHDIYIEPFIGSGAVMMNKRPAPLFSIGVDRDGFALNQIIVRGPAPFKSMAMNLDPYMAGRLRHPPESLLLHFGDALYWASDYGNMIRAHHPEARVFAYWDPPYLFNTRSQKDEPIYKHEFGTEEQHIAMLQTIKSLPWMHAISGYESELYSRELEGWREITFESVNRAGKVVTEHLWMNYQEPPELHDYRYLGDGWRERQKIRRQQKRWEARLRNMPRLQRYAMMSVIKKHEPGANTWTEEK